MTKVEQFHIYDIEVTITQKVLVTLDFDDVETNKTIEDFVKEDLIYNRNIHQGSKYEISKITKLEK